MSSSVTKDLEKLSNLLQKIYLKTKLNKFYNDAIELDQYIWSIPDKNKELLGIEIEGSHDGNKIKEMIKEKEIKNVSK
jgi:hypothetical protein